jgi:hypothetical protein
MQPAEILIVGKNGKELQKELPNIAAAEILLASDFRLLSELMPHRWKSLASATQV